jgi:hypothetical protein
MVGLSLLLGACVLATLRVAAVKNRRIYARSGDVACCFIRLLCFYLQRVYGHSSPALFPCVFGRYAHYDNNPSFSDFSSFGGWSSPHAKQYAGDVTACR